MLKAAIYARVSTDKQDVAMQLRELRQYVKKRKWKIYEEFVDRGYTGSNIKRPAFQEMMSAAHKRRFDVLLVWKLDRMSRSMKDLVSTLDQLGKVGVDFVSFSNDMDTTTSTGKLVFHVLGAVAEFERDIIRERVKAGLEHARAKGKVLGRPAVRPYLLEQAKALRKEGLSYRAIAKSVGIHHSTIIKKLG